ncbi:patatin-like phospholipase family protein [Ectothiorhodospira marina]|nr:patatin-like phospholipase family protein [Ectothiorhodospira marina]
MERSVKMISPHSSSLPASHDEYVEPRRALVLTGGGARAAYQVGVLKAMADLRDTEGPTPLTILCGVSAGGINAAVLAVLARDFRAGVESMEAIWGNFRAHQVYRADAGALLSSALRWSLYPLAARFPRWRPQAVLDNEPLRQLLTRTLDFSALDEAIAEGHLRAASVSAFGYASGESLTFYQGVGSIEPWRRAKRIGIPARLGIDHLMATSAIPFVFPAVRLDREYFGDGSMRHLSPISPAIHLGADRVLVISSWKLQEDPWERGEAYPSPGRIAGHALSSIFLDGLTVDLERMERINASLRATGRQTLRSAGAELRPIQAMVIAPSEDLASVAVRYRQELPRLMRAALYPLGAMHPERSELLSYLLFEAGFTRELIRLGYQDAMERRQALREFMGWGDREAVVCR